MSCEHAGGVAIRATARGPGDHEHEVGAAGGAEQRGADLPGIVRTGVQALGDGPALACERLQHRAVGIRDLARRKQVPGGRSSSPVGRIETGRAPRHAQIGVAGDRCQRDVVARDEATGREQ